MTDQQTLPLETSVAASGSAPPLVARPAPATAAVEPARTLLAWFIDDILMPAFRPRIARQSVWRWADKNVILNGASTGSGGRFRSSFTPWTRRFQDIFIDPYFREAHEMKSSRVGMTEAGFNIIRYMPTNAPGPAHFAITSAQKAADANRARIIPTLRSVIENEDTDPDDVTGRIVRLRNMEIRVTGSTSESAFRGEGSRLELVDEVEENGIIKGSGTLHNLARSRVTGVDGAKVMTMSKAREWGSPHHQEVDTGTLEANLVPCPICGAFQELSFDGTSPTEEIRIKRPIRAIPVRLGRVRFDDCRMLDRSWDYDRVQTETVYECVSGCIIDQDALVTAEHRAAFASAAALDESADYVGVGNHAKPRHRLDGFHGAAEVVRRIDAGIRTSMKWAMVNSGQWLRTNPRPEPFKVSQHISDLYSLHDDMKWGDLARIFLTKKNQADGLRYFHNNHLGLPHRETRSDIGEQQYMDCLSAYMFGTCPFIPHIAVTSADTQDALWKYVTLAARLDADIPAAEKAAGEAYAAAKAQGHEAAASHAVAAALKHIRSSYVEVAVVRWGIATTKAELVAELAVPVEFVDEQHHVQHLMSRGGLVDAAGHRTDDVYELHFQSGARYFPSFGRGGAALTKPVWRSETPIKWRMTELNVYFYNDDAWKRRFVYGMIAKVRQIKEVIEVKKLAPAAFDLPARFHIPGLPDDKNRKEFLAELQSEKINGDGDWEKNGPNDYQDAVKTGIITLDIRLPRLQADLAKRATEVAIARLGRAV